MSNEEFLYGCGVIPRGANRLITMSDSIDLEDSETIASSKSVYTSKINISKINFFLKRRSLNGIQNSKYNIDYQ